jgi:hypothetical protein
LEIFQEKSAIVHLKVAMKYKIYLNTLLFSLLFSCGKSQNQLPETATSNNSLLWEVTGKDLAGPSYFLGTMHILCPADAYISPQVQKVLDLVNMVYMEVDLSDMTQLFTGLKAMAMTDGTSLKDLLSPEDYQKVANYFKDKSPLPFSMLEQYKPMLLSSMVAESQLPCEASNGMELLLLEECSKRKLDIEGLETMAYQAGLFDSIPYAVQARELVKTIDSAFVQSDSIDSLLAAYRSQDLDAIERLTLSEEGGMAGNLDLLLYNRNRNWVDQFQAIASKQPTLFAVGAAHLAGKEGVIEMLKEKGYRLRPLKNEKGPQTKSL